MGKVNQVTEQCLLTAHVSWGGGGQGSENIFDLDKYRYDSIMGDMLEGTAHKLFIMMVCKLY